MLRLFNSKSFVLPAIALVIILFNSQAILHLPLDFDSSYNLLLARTFALTGHYATANYIIPGREFFPFDCWITTGFPVLALTGVVWMATGVSENVARIIMTCWAILFLLLSVFWVSKLLPKVQIAFLAIYLLALYLALDMHYMGINSLGEIPAAVFLLAATTCFHKKTRLSALFFGLLLGFSAVTKMMMAFGALPLGLTYVVLALKRQKFDRALLASVGGLLPFLIQVAWIWIQIPPSEWYGLQQSVWATQGAGLTWDSFNSFNHFLSRVGTLAGRDPLYLICGLLTIHLLCSQKDSQRVELLPVIGLFLFFLLLQNSDTPRHLVISKFLLLAFIGPSLLLCYQNAGLPSWLITGLGLALLALCVSLASSRITQTFQDRPARRDQIEFAQYLNTHLPKARIFFPGWWKAPEVQILSGRRFILYDQANLKHCRNECYLIVDPIMQMLVPEHASNAVNEFGPPAIEFLGYRLHRIIPHIR